MDFAVSANAPVGFVLILTRKCHHFYFLTGVKSFLYFLNARKSAPGIWRFIVLRQNEVDFWYNMHDTLVPRAWFPPQLLPLFNSCYHCWNYADIQAMNVLPFRTLLLHSKAIFPSSNFWYNMQHALWALGSLFSVWNLRGKGFFCNMHNCSCCLGCVSLSYGGWLSPVVLDWENWKNI